jgi:hypothetical protein
MVGFERKRVRTLLRPVSEQSEGPTVARRANIAHCVRRGALSAAPREKAGR